MCYYFSRQLLFAIFCSSIFQRTGGNLLFLFEKKVCVLLYQFQKKLLALIIRINKKLE